MELTEVLRRRRMVRRYDPSRPVAATLIREVLAAALRSPSAGFTQAVAYVVLTADDVAAYWAETVSEAEADRWLRGMRTAPVLVLVWTSEAAYLERYAEPDKGWTDKDPARFSAPYWYVDAGMAVMAALLRAVDLGLGACFFGVPPDRVAAVRTRFGVPADRESVGVLSLGYPDDAERRPLRRPRRPPIELTHFGHWSPAAQTVTVHA